MPDSPASVRLRPFLAMSGLGLLAGIAVCWLSETPTQGVAVVLVGLFLAGLFVTVGLDVYRRRFDPFEMKNVFLLFYALNSLSVPIRSLFVETESKEFALIVRGLGLCLAGLWMFLLGYSRKTKGGFLEFLIRPPRAWNLRAARWTAALFTVGGMAVFLAVLALTTGIGAYFAAGYGGRALMKTQLGPLEFGFYFSLCGILLGLAVRFLRGRGPSLTVLAGLAGFVVLMSWIGIRRPTFWILLAALALYHYLHKRIPLLKGILVTVVVGVAMIVFAYTRHIAATGDFLGSADYAVENFSWSWLDVSRTELGAPFKSLVSILGEVPDRTPFFWGRSYFETPLVFLPRLVFPERPQSISGWYERTFFSDDFLAEGGSMGVFIVAEAYANFGALGVMLILFLWGILLRTLYELFQRHPASPSHVFLYAVSLAWIVFLMRLDFAGAVKGYIVTALLPAGLALFMVRSRRPPA